MHKTIIEKERLVHYKRYYFSDNQICKAEDFNHAIRNHWGIENYAHRPKDICFNQDENQINIHNKAVNVAVFNTIALNNLTEEYNNDQPTHIKKNQILFRGHCRKFLNNHRI